MTDDINEIQELFKSMLSKMDEKIILSLRHNIEVNSVVTGLERHCFGVGSTDDVTPIPFTAFYINGEKMLEGHYITINIDMPEKDELLYLFSLFVSRNYKDIDPINTFNTFQNKIRHICERCQVFTINSSFINNLSDFKSALIIAPRFKDCITINFINKIEFYRSFFGNDDFEFIAKGHDYVYLMLNTRTGLIKIGQSKNPQYREKTLQGQEPEVVLIAYWLASLEREKELHIQFKEKRVRGEWFKLTFNELEEINKVMGLQNPNSPIQN